MSRSGYSEDCDDTLQYGRWRAQVKSAIRGKRGQALLRELLESLDAMPDKRLIRNELRKDGEMCTLGVLGAKRGMNLEAIDPEDHEIVASEFGVAHQLVREIEFENDEQCDRDTPEERWKHMRAWVAGQLNSPTEVSA